MDPLLTSQIRDLAAAFGSVVLVFSFLKAVFEYKKRGAEHRAEQFHTIWTQYMNNPRFSKIRSMIEGDDPAIAELPLWEKFEFLGFHEQIAIMMNTGLLSEAVVHYMFGYYATRIWDSELFWQDIDRNSPYWDLFRSFAETMWLERARAPMRKSTLRF